jgi:hypothetical protein
MPARRLRDRSRAMSLPDRSGTSSTRRRHCHDGHRTVCLCRRHQSRSSPRGQRIQRLEGGDCVQRRLQVARSRTTGQAHPTRRRMRGKGLAGPKGAWSRVPIPFPRSLPSPPLLQVAARHPPTTRLPSHGTGPECRVQACTHRHDCAQRGQIRALVGCCYSPSTVKPEIRVPGGRSLTCRCS